MELDRKKEKKKNCIMAFFFFPFHLFYSLKCKVHIAANKEIIEEVELYEGHMLIIQLGLLEQ